MSNKPVSKRVSRMVFNLTRKTVRLFSILAVFLICAFLFLRLYGLPGPILRELVKRANAAGIPVDVESVMLTLRGWKASNVSYYSTHPDDLSPMFQAREVLFARKPDLHGESSNGWKVDIKAQGIHVNPSVEWGVSMPAKSPCRSIDGLSLTLGVFPDRIEFSKGWMSWMGVNFAVDGTLLKKGRSAPGSRGSRPKRKDDEKQDTVLPVYVSAEQFQALEDRLKRLKIYGDADVGLQFNIDANDYSESSISYSMNARDVSIRDVEFDAMEVTGNYRYPELRFENVSVERNSQLMNLDGVYDLDTKLIQANVKNSITSRQMLLLAPQTVMDVLVKAQLQFDELPQFTLRLGPARALDIPNSISGSFSIRDVTYCGLLIESARGNIDRSDNRLDLSKIHAVIEGQEARAEEVGSSLHGGSMEASVYWDANAGWFGVKAEGCMDPNLFLQPLAIVPIATNAIGRFQFLEDAPQISLELGSSYIDWRTFFIDVQGMGNQVRFHDGVFSSMNTTASYSNGVLRVEPLAAMSGVDFMKGTAAIDFRESTVHFDIFGSLPPDLLEDAVYSKFNLFGNKINTAGNTQIKARGALDWKTMQATDFYAEVEADRLEIPVAGIDRFSAVVVGDGPQISVTNAVFDIYGGKGDAEFSIRLDPESEGMPYSMDLNLTDAEFKQCLLFVDLPCRKRTAGRLSADAKITADMGRDFFETANGGGSMAIRDGELADVPLFIGLSKLMRKVVPGFKTFSIRTLDSDFRLTDGVISSDNAMFTGDIFNMKAKGKYAQQSGFDAKIQLQMLNDKGLSKVFRVITDPLFRLFKLHLSGPLAEPSWRLENFTSTPKSNPAPPPEAEKTD